MAEENDVKILSWPDQALTLDHNFNPDQPCPVRVSFDDTPVHVDIDRPVQVEMTMDVVTKQDFPLCVKICEPICARSAYAITIDIFDRPVATIRLQGETRLEACSVSAPGVRIA